MPGFALDYRPTAAQLSGCEQRILSAGIRCLATEKSGGDAKAGVRRPYAIFTGIFASGM
jgi:hypothetical protein